ncbi:MAG: L-threonylcarbamoyladenylate synthase [Candidatus Micrarchaeia archaeon]
MRTIIFGTAEIRKAAKIIRDGGLVAFPTETVYGLGANALDERATKKIFEAKGRPSDNPLIIHIASKRQLHKIARIPENRKEIVRVLINKFWPGPLTLILPKRKTVPKTVTGGLNTVAVRMPKNKIALELIKKAGVPIAAPSANISGKPSGTCFEHVLEDFDGKIDGIIKSRSCKIGVESTVLDLTSRVPTILRPGGVNYEELKRAIPKLKVAKGRGGKIKSPGMKYRHYSPNAKVILFEKNSKLENYKLGLEKKGKRVIVIYPESSLRFSRRLFKVFRECDKKKIDYILIPAIEKKGIGLAIMNRIEKAAASVVR